MAVCHGVSGLLGAVHLPLHQRPQGCDTSGAGSGGGAPGTPLVQSRRVTCFSDAEEQALGLVMPAAAEGGQGEEQQQGGFMLPFSLEQSLRER